MLQWLVLSLQVWCLGGCFCTYRKQFKSLLDVKEALRKANIDLVNSWNDSLVQHADATIGRLNIPVQFPWPLNTGGTIQMPTNRSFPVPDISDFAGSLTHQVGINGSLPPFHLVGVGNFGFSIETFLISFDEGNVSSIQIVFRIPGWDAFNKFQFKVVQPKLIIQLGFANQTFEVQAKGFIAALNQAVSSSKSVGLPIQLFFPKHPDDSLQIHASDKTAVVDFNSLAPLFSTVADVRDTLKAITDICQTITVPTFILHVAPGFSNISIINVTTISVRPFAIVGKIIITNATFELSQVQDSFRAVIEMCGQQLRVAMLKDTGQHLTLEAEKQRNLSIGIEDFLSCVNERSDRRPDTNFMRINLRSSFFGLDLLKINYRLQPKLELAKMIILARLPADWNIFDQASLPTKLENSTLSVTVINPPGSFLAKIKGEVFGQALIGHPTLLAFPFVIEIPTKAASLSLSLQDREKMQLHFSNLLKLGGVSSVFPSFTKTILTDVMLRKLKLQFAATLTGSFQISEFRIEVPSKTKWNFSFYYLGNLKMMYTPNHTLISGDVILGNLKLHCQLE